MAWVLDFWDSGTGTVPWFPQVHAAVCVCAHARCCCRLLERHRVRTQALLSALYQAAQRGHQVVQRHSKRDGHQGPDRHPNPAADSGYQGESKGAQLIVCHSSSQILTTGTSRRFCNQN